MFSPSLVNPLQASLGSPFRRFGVGIPGDVVWLWKTVGTSLITRTGPQHSTTYTGTFTMEDGTVVAVPVDEVKGLYVGPGWTNLLTSAPSAPLAKTLTAQKYCLQCTGTGGEVTAGAYGTAVTGTPLQFTASAASQTFTPNASVTGWQLTASGGYVFPQLPPGITNPTAIGTTVNGASWPLTGSDKADKLLRCFDYSDHNYIMNSEAVGAAVGVAPTGWSPVHGSVASGITVSYVGAGTGYTDIRIHGTATGTVSSKIQPAGYQQAAVSGQVWSIAENVVILNGGLSAGGYAKFLLAEYNSAFMYIVNSAVDIGAGGDVFLARTLNQATCAYVRGYLDVGVLSGETIDFTIRISQPQLTKTSVKRTYVPTYGTAVLPNPAVLTVGVLCYMGVSSAELPSDNEIRNIGTVSNNQTGLLYFRRFSNGYAHPVRSFDGITAAGSDLDNPWPRDEFQWKFVQTNAAGTKFRVGSKRIGIDSAIVWSHATADAGVAFDGSFNPLTALRLAYNGTAPLWKKGAFVSNLSLSVAEIERRCNYIYRG